jgi:hypothetical protein
MFGNGNTPKAGVVDYATALQRYETAPTWRGCDERILTTRRCKTQSVRLNKDGDVIFRLWNTDCVIYRADGTLELEGYASALTNSFIRALTDHTVSVDLRGASGFVVFTGPGRDHGTFFDDSIALVRDAHGGWTPHPDMRLHEVMVPHLDRQRTREVLKASGYHDFANWARAAIRLGVLDTVSIKTKFRNEYYGMAPHQLLAALSDREQWVDVLRFCGPSAPDKMRWALYTSEGGVLDYTPVSGFDGGWRALRAINNRLRRYDDLS